MVSIHCIAFDLVGILLPAAVEALHTHTLPHLGRTSAVVAVRMQTGPVVGLAVDTCLGLPSAGEPYRTRASSAEEGVSQSAERQHLQVPA